MTNSISTTVVEVMRNIHDTVIMPYDSQCQSQPHDSLTSFNVKLSLQRLWQVMSRCHNKDILNNVIFALKMSLLSERHLMTVVMHKPYFIFKTYVMVCHMLCRCHVSLMHTPSSKVLLRFYIWSLLVQVSIIPVANVRTADGWDTQAYILMSQWFF